MATIQILRNGQITLPANVRQALKLIRGSFLDVKLKGKEIILTPQFLVDEKEMEKKVAKTINGIKERNKHFSANEVERDVAEAIEAVRKGMYIKTK